MILTLTKRIPSGSHNAPCDDDGEHWPKGQQFKLRDAGQQRYARDSGRCKPTSILVMAIGGEEVEVAVPMGKFMELFGVLPPASVIPLPTHVGTVLGFEAHNTQFCIKKIKRDTWTLSRLLTARIRFGTREQITSDVLHALETGVLPLSHERIA